MDRAGIMRSHPTLRVVGLLLLGQLVSFDLALLSLSSSLISQKLGVYAPLTQSLFIYASLALVYGSILLYRHRKPLVSWYWYLLLGFADVQGNYLVNKAYQYSSITSVTLLDCWTIPWVVILTWIFLGTRYSLWQLSGAALCVLGLCLVLFSDSGVGGGGGSRPVLGDVLVIAGTLFYGISNVGEEFCVKNKDRVEVVSMLGVFGLLISIVEVSVVELKTLESVKWSADIVLAFAGYAVSGFIFYTLAPFVLKRGVIYTLKWGCIIISIIMGLENLSILLNYIYLWGPAVENIKGGESFFKLSTLSGAAMFNLSILTSDMWVVVFRVFFYHQEVGWLYFLSFAVVVAGLIIYSLTGKDSVPASATEDGNLNTEYQMLYDESTASVNGSFAS